MPQTFQNNSGLFVEPVIQTSYKVFCAKHGTLAIGQSLQEATSYSHCHFCKEES